MIYVIREPPNPKNLKVYFLNFINERQPNNINVKLVAI